MTRLAQQLQPAKERSMGTSSYVSCSSSFCSATKVTDRCSLALSTLLFQEGDGEYNDRVEQEASAATSPS
jgi:hypothetical protein